MIIDKRMDTFFCEHESRKDLTPEQRQHLADQVAIREAVMITLRHQAEMEGNEPVLAGFEADERARALGMSVPAQTVVFSAARSFTKGESEGVFMSWWLKRVARYAHLTGFVRCCEEIRKAGLWPWKDDPAGQ